MNLGLLSLSARQREKQIRAWEMGREAAAGRCSEDQASGGQQGERSPDWERFRLGMGSGQSLMGRSQAASEPPALCRIVWRCPLGLVPGHQWRAFCAGRRLGKSSGGGCSGLQWGAVGQFVPLGLLAELLARRTTVLAAPCPVWVDGLAKLPLRWESLAAQGASASDILSVKCFEAVETIGGGEVGRGWLCHGHRQEHNHSRRALEPAQPP